jgi:hypothetical protein
VLMLMRSAAAPAIMRLVSLCALWRVLTKAARRNHRGGNVASSRHSIDCPGVKMPGLPSPRT